MKDDNLGWAEVMAWLAEHAAEARYGRLMGELTVTPEAYLSIPGHGAVFVNNAGEAVWRKKIIVIGAPTLKIGLNVIDPAEGMLLG